MTNTCTPYLKPKNIALGVGLWGFFALSLLAIAQLLLLQPHAVIAQSNPDPPPHTVRNPEHDARFEEVDSTEGDVPGFSIRPTEGEEWENDDAVYVFDSDASDLNRADGSDRIVFTWDRWWPANDRHIIVDLEPVSGLSEASQIRNGWHYKGGAGEQFYVSIENANGFVEWAEDYYDENPPPEQECRLKYETRNPPANLSYPFRGPDGGIDSSSHLAIVEATDGGEEVHWFIGFPNDPSDNRAIFGSTGGSIEYFVSRGTLDNLSKTSNGSCIDNPQLARDFMENVDETGAPEGGNDEPECEGRGFTGFMVCDILISALGWIESAQTWLVEILFKTEPLSLDTSEDNPLYTIWSNVRNIANVLLIVAFMAIIFSLALSVNVDTYAVKRMLPRLLVAAVTIQLSYFLSALMIDATNVLGAGLQGLSEMALDDADIAPEGYFTGGVGTVASGGLLLFGIGSVAVGLIGGSLGILGVLALLIGLAFLIIIAALIIVALREILIMICVVFSPIALLANLLPNTEKWFKFWWSNFARLLLMYPFIILMIQMGNIGSLMVLSEATDTQDFLAPLMAILMQLVALGSIFLAFKVGGSMLSVITQGATKYSKGLGGGKGKGAKGGKGAPAGGGGGGPLAKLKQQHSEGMTRGAASSNWARRTLSKPSTAFGEKLSGRSRAQAVTDYNQTVAASAETLKGEGVEDPDLLNHLAQVGGDEKAAWARVKELKGSKNERDRDLGSALEGKAHHFGNKATQAAALKQAAGKGKAEMGSFQAVAKSLSGQPNSQKELISNYAAENASNGAVQYKGAHIGKDGGFEMPNDEGLRKNLRGALTSDPKSISADSLKYYGGANPEGKNMLQEELDSPDTGSTTEHALGSAIQGMSAEQRQAVRGSLRDGEYERIRQPYMPGGGGQPGGGSGPQSGPSGGGGSNQSGGGPQGGAPGGGSSSGTSGGGPSSSGGSSSGGASFGGSSSGGGSSGSSGGSGSSQGNPSSGSNRGGGNPRGSTRSRTTPSYPSTPTDLPTSNTTPPPTPRQDT